jgi:hypothetical protein
MSMSSLYAKIDPFKHILTNKATKEDINRARDDLDGWETNVNKA